jgi:hypothetical protein
VSAGDTSKSMEPALHNIDPFGPHPLPVPATIS